MRRLSPQGQFAWHMNALWATLRIALATAFKKSPTDLPAAMNEFFSVISAICQRLKSARAGSLSDQPGRAKLSIPYCNRFG